MNTISHRAPLSFSLAAVANAFFAVGLVLIVIDAFLFREILSLATTPYSTRAIMGFHLYPSEMWFLFVGNAATAMLLARDYFLIPKHDFDRAIPIFIVLAVYSTWFVYGFIFGNSWALQEFREMVFSALALPAILYFAPYANARWLFERLFVPLCLFTVPVAMVASRAGSGLSVHNSVLILSVFVAGFYFFKLLNERSSAAIALTLIAIPFLLKFSKPMVALLLLVLTITFLLSGRLNPLSVRWVLSRFKMRMLTISLGILGVLLLIVVGINVYYDGIIEQAVRYYVLKERISAAGELRYGDLSGGRLAIWKAAVVGWTEKPLFGHGLGATVEAYATGWLTKTQFHNYILQALHNTGAVGILLLGTAWLVWFRRTIHIIGGVERSHMRVLPAAMLIYVVGMFAYGLYGHSLSYPPSAQLFWLCVGFLSVYKGDLE